MAWFDGLKNLFGRKESAVARTIVRQYAPGQAVWSEQNFEKLAKEGYSTSVYVFAAVGKVAQACGGIPWVLYQTKKDGDEEEITRHPLLDLMKQPNPMQGRAQFIENVVAFRLLAGNSYIERVGASTGQNAGKPREMYSLRPDRTQIIVGDPKEPVAGYKYQAGGGEQTVPGPFMLHWKTFNPLDDWYGLPPLVAAARAVDQSNSAQAYNVSLMQNSARPSGLLILESETLTQADVNDFRDELETNWKGVSNIGRPGVLSKGVKWQQTAFTPEEISWLEGQKLSANQIAVAFGVPGQMLGIEGSLTFANYAEARTAFYQDTVLPLMDNLRDELNRWLTPLFGEGLRLDYDSDAIEALQEDRDKLYGRTINAFREGVLKLNDARGALGFDDDAEFGEKYAWQVKPKSQPMALKPGDDPANPGGADVTGQQNESHQRDDEEGDDAA